MATAETNSPRRDALLDTLGASFAVFRDGQPLASGIHKAILERMASSTAIGSMHAKPSTPARFTAALTG